MTPFCRCCYNEPDAGEECPQCGRIGPKTEEQIALETADIKLTIEREDNYNRKLTKI